MITGATIKAKRVAAGIPGQLLCSRAGFSRSRLSAIERGYFTPPSQDLAHVDAILERLIQAKAIIDQVATSIGWPVPGKP